MEKKKLPPEFLEMMSEVIRILGHSQRLQIIEYLDIHGESSVNDIVEGIGARQGAVSQHLNKMRMAGMLTCRRDSRQVYYTVAAEGPVTILTCLRRKFESM